MLARDEMANMVWAIERGITLTSGVRKNGREAAAEMLSFFERELDARLGAPAQPPPPAPGAKVWWRSGRRHGERSLWLRLSIRTSRLC